MCCISGLFLCIPISHPSIPSTSHHSLPLYPYLSSLQFNPIHSSIPFPKEVDKKLSYHGQNVLSIIKHTNAIPSANIEGQEVKDQGYRRPKLCLEVWRRHRDREKGSMGVAHSCSCSPAFARYANIEFCGLSDTCCFITLKWYNERNVACEKSCLKCMARGSSPSETKIYPSTLLHFCVYFLTIMNFTALLFLNGSTWRHTVCEANVAHEKSFIKMYGREWCPKGRPQNAKCVAF